MRRLGCKVSNVLLILTSTAVLLLTYKLHLCNVLHKDFLMDEDNQVIQYDRNMPVIVIGGVHHSGAHLLQALLDAHSEIRCDDEIFFNSLVFNTIERWTRVEKISLYQAGVTKNVLDSALAAFFLETLALNGEPARWLCTNSPFMLRSADHVSKVLPQAKFIFVVRDGRAVVHSNIANEVMIHGCNISNFRGSLKVWNDDISTMYHQCKLVGNRRCMLVHYEELVLHPVSLMKQILTFVEVPWDESILHSGKKYTRGFGLTKYTASDPINVDTLRNWVDHLPLDVVQDMNTLAPMLATLGYDPRGNPPKYYRPQIF